jgi:hypothetical protein
MSCGRDRVVVLPPSLDDDLGLFYDGGRYAGNYGYGGRYAGNYEN